MSLHSVLLTILVCTGAHTCIPACSLGASLSDLLATPAPSLETRSLPSSISAESDRDSAGTFLNFKTRTASSEHLIPLGRLGAWIFLMSCTRPRTYPTTQPHMPPTSEHSFSPSSFQQCINRFDLPSRAISLFLPLPPPLPSLPPSLPPRPPPPLSHSHACTRALSLSLPPHDGRL